MLVIGKLKKEHPLQIETTGNNLYRSHIEKLISNLEFFLKKRKDHKSYDQIQSRCNKIKRARDFRYIKPIIEEFKFYNFLIKKNIDFKVKAEPGADCFAVINDQEVYFEITAQITDDRREEIKGEFIERISEIKSGKLVTIEQENQIASLDEFSKKIQQLEFFVRNKLENKDFVDSKTEGFLVSFKDIDSDDTFTIFPSATWLKDVYLTKYLPRRLKEKEKQFLKDYPTFLVIFFTDWRLISELVKDVCILPRRIYPQKKGLFFQKEFGNVAGIITFSFGHFNIVYNPFCKARTILKSLKPALDSMFNNIQFNIGNI